jgi:hypothetical protein
VISCSRKAVATAWVRVSASSFAIALRTCVRTVDDVAAADRKRVARQQQGRREHRHDDERSQMKACRTHHDLDWVKAASTDSRSAAQGLAAPGPVSS